MKLFVTFYVVWENILSSHSYSAQRALFKAYDIRGKHTLFTDAFVWDLSRVFANDLLLKTKQINTQHLTTESSNTKRPTVVIGYDTRQGSLAIAQKFAHTFSQSGINVVWIGLVTTPIMAFWANQYEGHGFIATASHSARHINGLKWLLFGESPSSSYIEQLHTQLADLQTATINKNAPADKATDFEAFEYNLPHLTVLTKSKVTDDYINMTVRAIEQVHIQSDSNITPSDPLKIVIDCLNGATGPYAHAFFTKHPSLCSEVIVLNDNPDGNFPKGNPDPTESGRLNELSLAVLTHQADIGLAFDGDGDRLMVVDNQGKVIAPDHLLYLLALVALDGVERSNNPHHETVIFDVKCSHHLPKLIEKIGATPQMTKTGSSLMRRALQTADKTTDNQALFAGELSGHFLFNDGYFTLHDDAMYAALRLIHWLNCKPKHQSHQQFIAQSLHEAHDTKLHSQTQPEAQQLPNCLSCIIEQLPNMVSTSDVYLPLTFYRVKNRINSSDENVLLSRLSNLCQTLQKNCLPSQSHHSFTEHCQTALINKASKFGLPKNTLLTTIDGIRLDFPNGFGVIRKSNTSNCLTVRFAGNSLSDLKDIQHYFVMLCESIDSNLANHIANIPATA